jgi:hypothetical protein
MIESILTAVFSSYGAAGLIIVAVMAMVGTATSQLIATRKWMEQTTAIANKLDLVASAMERQGKFCERHYEAQRDHMDTLRSIGGELRGLVEAIHESDMTRARELMDIIKSDMTRGRELMVLIKLMSDRRG